MVSNISRSRILVGSALGIEPQDQVDKVSLACKAYDRFHRPELQYGSVIDSNMVTVFAG